MFTNMIVFLERKQIGNKMDEMHYQTFGRNFPPM